MTVLPSVETMNPRTKPIDELVAEKIHERTGRRVQNLTVELAGDRIVLRGRARSFHVKQLALHGVRELLPTAALHNAIEVEACAVA